MNADKKKRLRKTLKIALVLLFGMIIGLVTGTLAMAWQTRKLMSIYAQANLLETVNDAQSLNAGKWEAILDMKDMALPQLVEQFEHCHAKFLTPEQRLVTLQLVKRYYIANPDLQFSPEIKKTLESIPTRAEEENAKKTD